MKTRQGFVSNSSSSSFVAIVEEDVFKKALVLIKDGRYRKILKGISKKQNVFGKKAVVIQEMSDHRGYSSIFGDGVDIDYEEMGITAEELEAEDADGDEFYPFVCLYEYQEVLKKLMKNKDDKQKILILDNMGNG